MRNVSDKVVQKNQNTHFIVNKFFEIHAVYEIMWKNYVEPERIHMTIWRMCIACWIPKSTNIHSEYVILIDLPQQL